MVRESETRAVPRGDARKAQAKAEEFLSAASIDLEAARWSAAGLTAIHAGICAADAALIASVGVRSVSPDHGAAATILERKVPESTAAQRRQLIGLINMKNTTEYEQRALTEIEARRLVDHAQRLVAWARKVVSNHGL
jgi:HEPN domain-containing protein